MSLVVSPVAESLTARRHGESNSASSSSSSSSGHLSTLFVLAGSAGSMTVKANEVTSISEINELLNPPADLVRLSDVHRPGILFTLRQRYAEDQIYSSIGPILIALNPFKWIKGIYEEGVIRAYERGELNLSEQPHVFAVAHDALFGLFGLEGRTSQNQSLIVSGESGSGKTEATKQCLNYLAATCGTSKTSGTSIQTKILQASPVLEAWGNAKTLRNNNSSRFGKFIQVFLDKKSRKISGATNTTYLLEKSRVVFQEKGERNYHIFYQILRGASVEQLEALSLSQISANPALSNYLSRSECLYIDDVDDRADYAAVQEAYGLLGFEPDVPDALSRVLAGILHFGNIDFVENSDDEDVERRGAGSRGCPRGRGSLRPRGHGRRRGGGHGRRGLSGQGRSVIMSSSTYKNEIYPK
jgi:myosin heavy subunit